MFKCDRCKRVQMHMFMASFRSQYSAPKCEACMIREDREAWQSMPKYIEPPVICDCTCHWVAGDCCDGCK